MQSLKKEVPVSCPWHGKIFFLNFPEFGVPE